ncbi:GPI-anchor transamidase component PIGS [Petromyzon marinus]|uniref:GPI transamidase component PIG-S isoform X2 n=1 Tax=Petromyzon marinus TaxID=7757 RepID=A0AAJ7UL64_PETMA|nr:GPI transamidase component PIG-S isoform X2 [Petromyzon marinus]
MAADTTAGMSPQKFSAVFVAAFSLLVGLPVWWRTTAVTRTALPHADIARLDHAKVELLVPIEVVVTAQALSAAGLDQATFAAQLIPDQHRVGERRDDGGDDDDVDEEEEEEGDVAVQYNYRAREASSEEEEILRHLSMDSATLAAADDGISALPSANLPGTLSLYILHDNRRQQHQQQQQQEPQQQHEDDDGGGGGGGVAATATPPHRPEVPAFSSTSSSTSSSSFSVIPGRHRSAFLLLRCGDGGGGDDDDDDDVGCGGRGRRAVHQAVARMAPGVAAIAAATRTHGKEGRHGHQQQQQQHQQHQQQHQQQHHQHQQQYPQQQQQQTRGGRERAQEEARSMRALPSSLGYELTFTLLNPDPRRLEVSWDMAAAVEAHLRPFLDKVTHLADFTVSSQVLHYAGLGVRPRLHRESGAFLLPESSLPHLINPMEARLGSPASPMPVLHFLLYVTEPSFTPLHLLTTGGRVAPHNAFLIPRWGGIMIFNPDLSNSSHSQLPIPVRLDTHHIMEVFITQLRALLGVRGTAPTAVTSAPVTSAPVTSAPTAVTSAPVTSAPVTPAPLAGWELDELAWRRCAELLAGATGGLASLAQLLGEIHNIVIALPVAHQVEVAVRSSWASLADLREGRLEAALGHAGCACRASEAAFYDPSLLALLYFPDDQKFAIYIPLFLPVAIPVLLALWRHLGAPGA